MFTGLIETLGSVRRLEGDSPRRITIASSIPEHEVAIGDSIAINGCCLTMVERQGQGLCFEAAAETLKRTTIGELRLGDKVNLERAMRLGDRLAGHLVSGHVDGVGQVQSRTIENGTLYLGIEAPTAIAPLIASQGSVAVAGVSLTVTQVRATMFWVALIAHTRHATTLDTLGSGARVNVEADLIARYVQRLQSCGKESSSASLTPEFLKDKGFL